MLTGQRKGDPELKPDEAALLDNYRNSPEEGKRAIEATSAALSKRESVIKGKEALIKKV